MCLLEPVLIWVFLLGGRMACSRRVAGVRCINQLRFTSGGGPLKRLWLERVGLME